MNRRKKNKKPQKHVDRSFYYQVFSIPIEKCTKTTVLYFYDIQCKSINENMH